MSWHLPRAPTSLTLAVSMLIHHPITLLTAMTSDHKV